MLMGVLIKIIGNDAIWYDFLLMFSSNCDYILHSFQYIWQTDSWNVVKYICLH